MDEIEQGKEENPDQVNQMPVKAAVLKEYESCTVDCPAFHFKIGNQKQYHPDDDVEGVQAGHKEV